VQTLGVAELKVTAKPDVAVALAVVVPPTTSVVGLKLIAPIV
jgi:flagellar assembly factor FliW